MSLPFDHWIAQSVSSADLAVLHGLHLRSSTWIGAMAVLSLLGSGWSMIPIASLLGFGGTRRWAAKVLVVLTAVAAVVFVMKSMVGRVRPCAAIPGVVGLAFPAPTDPSFPSGHAAGAFAFAVFVALESRLHAAIKIGVLLLAAGVAMSRVALGVHYPSDVAAGAWLGTALSLAASLALSWRRRLQSAKGRSRAP